MLVPVFLTQAALSQLPTAAVVHAYKDSHRRLLVLGYNATLTTSVEAPRQPRRHYDQMKALARVNPSTLKCIKEVCQHPQNMVIIVSGSECSKLQDQFGHLPVWLAAENGVYMRPPSSLHDVSTVSSKWRLGWLLFSVWVWSVLVCWHWNSTESGARSQQLARALNLLFPCWFLDPAGMKRDCDTG